MKRGITFYIDDDVDVVKEGIGNLDGFGMLERCIDEMPTVIEADGGAE